MDKIKLKLSNKYVRIKAVEAVSLAPEGYVVEIKPPTRNLDQNALLWALLQDVSAQVVWHGMTLKPEEWKDIFTASLNRQKVVPGIDGGFVVLGTRTSTMTKKEFSELCELIHCFGAENSVRFGCADLSDKD